MGQEVRQNDIYNNLPEQQLATHLISSKTQFWKPENILEIKSNFGPNVQLYIQWPSENEETSDYFGLSNWEI